MFGITVMKYSRYRELKLKLKRQEDEIKRLQLVAYELANKNSKNVVEQYIEERA